jgi:hypothetical protein
MAERTAVEHTVIPRERLVQGTWYYGDGWTGKVALWDGEMFLSYAYDTHCIPVVLMYCAAVDGFTPHRVL